MTLVFTPCPAVATRKSKAPASSTKSADDKDTAAASSTSHSFVMFLIILSRKSTNSSYASIREIHLSIQISWNAVLNHSGREKQ
mmetsp:Transcript_6789/g.12419  ORF Transcript_6789/g.12419 Transcript_6789/m.12419 type:complete len:84 (+) Transcript_6789:649-900(+)